jgi:hypothetical protein
MRGDFARHAKCERENIVVGEEAAANARLNVDLWANNIK